MFEKFQLPIEMLEKILGGTDPGTVPADDDEDPDGRTP